MRRAFVFCIDFGLIAAATLLAFVVRDNFVFNEARVSAALPYLGLTLAAAVVAIPLFQLHRSVWRFSALVDYLYVLVASAAIVIPTVTFAFALNRLEGVPRSIPVIQFLMIVTLLMAPRVFMRLRHANRATRVAQFSESPAPQQAPVSVLIVGMNRLTELYLQSVQDLNPNGLRVAGLLGHNERHTGRLMQRCPVLGTPEQLIDILRMLKVHGVAIDRIVVTARRTDLSFDAQAALRSVETSGISIQHLAETLGFDPHIGLEQEQRAQPLFDHLPSIDSESPLADHLSISREERDALKRRSYWALKRGLDVLGAAILILLLAPVMAIVTILVLFDVGKPILFWQQRPGLGGRPFNVYKLRTMRDAHDEDGNPVPDDQRLSTIGTFLRRSRLDELPQLFQILKGDMSFVGPRPLLPVDQPLGLAARLLVRPGLTGWAQVRGGRQIPAEDKAALDIWYVRHASLWLDVTIVVRTAVMLLFGERAHPEAIRQAWQDVRNKEQEVVAANALEAAVTWPRKPGRAA